MLPIMNELEKEKSLAKKALKLLRPSWCELRYDEIKNKPYLIGKKKDSLRTETIYVTNAYKALDFDGLKTVIADSGQSSVALSIQSSDSTNVFYRCEIGLKSVCQRKNEESSEQVNKSDSEVDSDN
nr:uncharacterized protein LOC107451614 [Parasteatoda tepidariorum]